ncbi:MAG: cytochrome d ubiquinol oxidase subunit II [Pseudomonadota bacterium]
MLDLIPNPSETLPLIFAGLMGLSILIYVVLDGYDLGVGTLFAFAPEEDYDQMVASIGPFWDANETWLVLAIGILLVAFPAAHGTILTALYVPVSIMLIGLILRGVAFEFRAKAPGAAKQWWNLAFFAGSSMAGLSQGYMLGVYILGLEHGWGALFFGLLTAFCLLAAYVFIGAAWLIYKTEGALQERAVRWARMGLLIGGAGMVAVSLATPLASDRIFEKWFSFPEIILLAPLPMMTAGLFVAVYILLKELPLPGDRWSWGPFVGGTAIFSLGFAGQAYSFYPFIVPGQLTIVESASAPESLAIILAGTCIVLPTIIGYTVFAYHVFGGKAQGLSYGD